MSSIQKQVAELVKNRGYWDGLGKQQLVCRHAAKLVEELAEAVEYTIPPYPKMWQDDLVASARDARLDFDNLERWTDYWILDENELKRELADIQVVLLSMSEVLEFDILAVALDKAQADVGRGVREP